MSLKDKIVGFNLSGKIEKALIFIAENASSGGVDFSKLTEEQKKQIANAVETLDALAIKWYSYDTGVAMPIIINDQERLSLTDTNGDERKIYPLSASPMTVKFDGAVNLGYGNGEYLYVYIGINNGNDGSIQKLVKTIDNDVLIENADKPIYFQFQKQNFGSDLVLAQPYNLTIDNQTTEDVKIKLEAQYNTGDFIEGNSGSVQPYTNWDYAYPRVFVDLTNSSDNLVAELWKADDSQRIYTRTLNAGQNHRNSYTGQMRQSSYSTRDYKVVIRKA